MQRGSLWKKTALTVLATGLSTKAVMAEASLCINVG